VFRLVSEPVRREFAPGLVVNCWGYNGQTPGPTIEVVEGDRVRIYVTNNLPEPTSVHWHGILLPNGMDGVSGLNQPAIKPGQTFRYEFTLRQHGTHMYHPHFDEMVQMGQKMIDRVRRRGQDILCDADVRKEIASASVINTSGGGCRYRQTVVSVALSANRVRGTDILDIHEYASSCRLKTLNISIVMGAVGGGFGTV
jgi:hypothetical protein